MGASSSKAAARGAARKYPTRSPGAVPQATTQRARPQQPAPRGDGTKDEGEEIIVYSPNVHCVCIRVF